MSTFQSSTNFNLPTKVHKRTCDDYCYGDNLINYNHDHVKFSHIYHILYKNIQRQVQTYGAVSAYFSLYDAPFLYKSGVYRTEQSEFVRHAYAKLIGREVENGVDFWLLVNSWGYEWGRMDCSKPRGAQMRANLVVILLQVYLKFNNIFL